jgi:hypothetical protein
VPEELEVAWRLTSKELRGKRREFGGERSARGGGPLRDGRAFDEPSLSHASVEVWVDGRRWGGVGERRKVWRSGSGRRVLGGNEAEKTTARGEKGERKEGMSKEGERRGGSVSAEVDWIIADEVGVSSEPVREPAFWARGA